MKTKYYIKTRDLTGTPQLSDFKIIEENIDENLSDEGKQNCGLVYFKAVSRQGLPVFTISPLMAEYR